MPTIEALLNSAELPDSPSARLDAELLLAHVLGKPRSYLRTWPERGPTLRSAPPLPHCWRVAVRASRSPTCSAARVSGAWSWRWRRTP